MEDALAPLFHRGRTVCHVLILVVMEDALARESVDLSKAHLVSLNPCCNGRCTRTISNLFLPSREALS